jgi:hypothetical protein
VAKPVGGGVRTVRRVDGEPDVTHVDTRAERERRGLGRPAKAELFRAMVAEILAGEPDLLSVEILLGVPRLSVEVSGHRGCAIGHRASAAVRGMLAR